MPELPLAAELAQRGMNGPIRPVPLAEAERYCRELAASHYENFSVVTRLVPRHLRQHMANVYAYCRWVDDLADETGDPQTALRMLDWWEQRLDDCYAGRPAVHPVFAALSQTIQRFEIPKDSFVDLLAAMRQDQQVVRYETADEVAGYCRNSANPVGRLVLYLGECHAGERLALSDHVCTGLQLINFCQDVARDWDNGRVYLPRATCREAGYDEGMFAVREYNDAFRRVMEVEVARAEQHLLAGRPLVGQMPRGLALPVELFVRGGLSVVEAIRRIEYNVWHTRPTVGKFRKLRLVVSAWLRHKLGRNADG